MYKIVAISLVFWLILSSVTPSDERTTKPMKGRPHDLSSYR
jgi:hypothetical protein